MNKTVMWGRITPNEDNGAVPLQVRAGGTLDVGRGSRVYGALAAVNATFSAGQVIGGGISLTVGRASDSGGVITTLTYIDNSNAKKLVDVYFFTQALATPPASGATFAPTAADLQNFVGGIEFILADYYTFNARAAAQTYGFALPYYGTTLVAYVVARESTTLNSTNALIVGVLQD
jgi:hypothetical protein